MSEEPKNADIAVSSQPLVELRKAMRVIGSEVKTTLVADINLAIAPGEFVAVTGQSGSGKS